ncbi:hypothetical protein JVU11DRAFT_8005 [Chiua virens]|nr:hypothetical protein JVU11DRAFT_8005 [Chiua virens]
MSVAPSQPQPPIQDTGPTQQRIHKSPSIGELSIIQRSSTTVEVCGHGTTFPSFLGTSEFFYDARAGACSFISSSGDEPNNTYENPLITATSRALISDIHTLTRRYRAIDVPRPLSILCTLLRMRPPNKHAGDPWFKAIRMWAEIDDVSETESFDGHKKSFVEYTLNVLFFPDLHSTYRVPKTLMLHRPPASSP